MVATVVVEEVVVVVIVMIGMMVDVVERRKMGKYPGKEISQRRQRQREQRASRRRIRMRLKLYYWITGQMGTKREKRKEPLRCAISQIMGDCNGQISQGVGANFLKKRSPFFSLWQAQTIEITNLEGLLAEEQRFTSMALLVFWSPNQTCLSSSTKNNG